MGNTHRYDRRHSPIKEDNRTAAQRDRDRILYNSAFRRLAGVTQVVSADEGDVFHNRLTHSLKVAQFGRRIAEHLAKETDYRVLEQLGGLDPDVVETACLAHDIGHPPFGHVAEKELQKLSEKIGSFEGNAQSFRVVTNLALHAFWDSSKSSPRYRGLDLTRASLNAVLKYPWKFGENGEDSKKKWGAYQSESDDFGFARDGKTQNLRSLEAELMNWADDVTYSVHDMEDFYKAGLIPLDRLRLDPRSRGKFFDAAFSRANGDAAKSIASGQFSKTDLESSFEAILGTMPIEEPYSGTHEQRCRLRSLTSGLIGMYIKAAYLTSDSDNPLIIEPERQRSVLMFKELTWQFVILNPNLGTQQHGHRKIIGGLFDMYKEQVEKNKFEAFPVGTRESLLAASSEPERLRACIDLIAGMTEQQAVQMYQRMAGIALGSALLTVVR